MKKIVLVPLDERPCNHVFPEQLAAISDFTLVKAPIHLLGNKKVPAKVEELWEWLYQEIQDADCVVLSIDMLLYGGIVPSRLHTMNETECRNILNKISKLKELNPSLTVYTFHLIMRCPSYSSSDEEPDYYEDWGRDIFRYGFIKHKQTLNLADDSELKELTEIKQRLPKEYLNDYLDRRKKNTQVNQAAVELVAQGAIDFHIIPQDDAAPYGLTAQDQQLVRSYVQEKEVMLKVYMYPGADEVGNVLITRFINKENEYVPKVYPRYSSVHGPNVIPRYEDRPFGETLKYQIMAAGGILVDSEPEANIVLLINSPGEDMMEASQQNDQIRGYEVFRNITELAEYGEYVTKSLKKHCAVADVAFANGGDLQFIKLLKQKEILFELSGYAGWNTSSNTLGTVIPHSMLTSFYGRNETHLDFLSLRFVEDAGYCGQIRRKVCDQHLPEMGHTYMKVDGQTGEVAVLVKRELEAFIQKELEYDNHRVLIDFCYMPWSRMFEVGLSVSYSKSVAVSK
ncbi:DUF4127 family protein [Metabacillus sp. cB07]|uniref:DUF4127 family protein n=1 Tax=Metabacillus sp. cB07 TaxID=2806989 RepID=UPI00193AD130|nr:DUF4127 family protein [Metabacillus sp. cB07]